MGISNYTRRNTHYHNIPDVYSYEIVTDTTKKANAIFLQKYLNTTEDQGLFTRQRCSNIRPYPAAILGAKLAAAY